MALACVAGGPALLATTPERSFFAAIDVNLVDVEVVVTDRDGTPVTDLTRDDFRLLEDGEPVDVAFFEAPSPAGVAASADRAAPARNLLNLVILFDDTNLSIRTRDQILDNLERHLAGEPTPGVRTMVARYGGSLEILQPLTNDRAAVLAALGRLRELPSRSRARERGRILREMQDVAAGSNLDYVPHDPSATAEELRGAASRFTDRDAALAFRRIGFYARSASEVVKASSAVLERLAGALGGLPGRTLLLLASDTTETAPGTTLYRTWEQLFASSAGRLGLSQSIEAAQFNAGRELVALGERASASRVAVVALSAERARLLQSVTADRKGSSMASAFESGDQLRSGDAHELLAELTGGQVIRSSRRMEPALAALEAGWSHPYLLAFKARSPDDGQVHRIDVELVGDGLTVHHRRCFEAPSSRRALERRTQAAALFGVVDDALGVAVERQAEEVRGAGTFLVSLLVKIPLGRLALVPDGASHRGRLTLLIATSDPTAGVSQAARREVPIEILNARLVEALERDAEVLARIVLPAGRQRVAIGVLDELGGASATTTLDLVVGTGSE